MLQKATHGVAGWGAECAPLDVTQLATDRSCVVSEHGCQVGGIHITIIVDVTNVLTDRRLGWSLVEDHNVEGRDRPKQQ